MKKFMRALAADILSAVGPGRAFVAVDGVDGSGKTSFAANLVFEIQNRPVIVIHADDFLNPSPVRHARGRASPEGFWEDTYNYRYVGGQRLYFDAARPWERATFVVDNSVWTSPKIIPPDMASTVR